MIGFARRISTERFVDLFVAKDIGLGGGCAVDDCCAAARAFKVANADMTDGFPGALFRGAVRIAL